jgi:holo-[acyl-carrier protein] synthase
VNCHGKRQRQNKTGWEKDKGRGFDMGIGIDIEEVGRFEKFLKDKNRLERLFSKDEIDYCLGKKNASQHLAARFAAKEAVWKALAPKNQKLLISDISIKNDNHGKPQVYIKGKRLKTIDISLTHTKKYAATVAITNSD